MDTNENIGGRKLMLWGFSLDGWQTVLLWFAVVAACLTVVGGVLGILSGYIGYEVSKASSKEADVKIAEAQEKSTRAERDAAHARSVTAAIERENIQLRTKLEEERTARLKLEEKIRPRHLSEEQKAIVVAAISRFAGQPIRLAVQMGDSETNQYALDFVDVFRRAKWKLEGGISTGVTQVLYDVDPGGAKLYLRPEVIKSASPAALALHKALNEIGVLTDKNLLAETPLAELKADTVELRLGKKPD